MGRLTDARRILVTVCNNSVSTMLKCTSKKVVCKIWSKYTCTIWFKSCGPLDWCSANPSHCSYNSVSTMLNCTSKKVVCKIWSNIPRGQWVFSLKSLRSKWCSAKPRRRFAYQLLDNIKINKHARFYPNIPRGSRVMGIFSLIDHDQLNWCSVKPRQSKSREEGDNSLYMT